MKALALVLVAALYACAAESAPANRLVHESSPYLLQHAHNPVDWYPWGDEAFEKAKREHKPVFLSIGYSTCHWCHVMEEESFENEAIAALLNRYFVAVKVDKEELPHVDKYFQNLHVLLKRRTGGWPLTVLLTEEMRPFFIATYLPPVDGYGAEGMIRLLPRIGERYRDDPTALQAEAASVAALAEKVENVDFRGASPGGDLARRITAEAATYYDARFPGFSERPKFPESSLIALLLDVHRLSGDAKALEMAQSTLDAMARGGLYDQVDGAFYRYTVDRSWQIPHFEKMLYTNAELVPLYVRMHRLDPSPLYENAVRATLAEMKRRFGYDGLFFSASDADSGGEEGGYFLHTYAAAKKALLDDAFTPAGADAVLAYLGIAEDGNFDGERSNPHITASPAPERLDDALAVLRNIRETRTYPFVDRKIITSWNAMQIAALFEASAIDPSFREEARASMAALLGTLYKDGMLYHQFLAGTEPRQHALLEDHAFLIKALLTGYAATFDDAYLSLADTLAQDAVARFYREGRWYLSDDGFRSPADLNDRYYTSPLSVMVGNLMSLAALEEDLSFYKLAKTTLEGFGLLLERNPSHYPEAARAALRMQKGDILLKTSRSNLAALKTIDYPYLLQKAADTDRYLACRIGSCFASEKTFEDLKQAIEAER